MRGESLRVRTVAPALMAVLAVVAGACGDEPTDTYDAGTAPTSATSTTVAPGGINSLTEPERVPRLIREHLGDEDPELRRLSLNPHGFSFELRDPVKRDNIDDFSFYDGRWDTRPVSVSLSDIEAFESVTFYLGDIDFAVVPSLVAQALDGLELEGEEVNGVSYDRLAGERPRVYIGVTGLRGSGRLIAKADGTEVEVSRN